MSRRLTALLVALPLLVGAWVAPAEASSRVGQFVVRCRYSHTLPDDPIVFPGQPGASHSHDFFGSAAVDAFSTYESLLEGPTTCRLPSDTAGYWTPTAYLDGEPIVPLVMRIYYLGHRATTVETIPPGLQVIGGNRDATSSAENPHVRWSCGQTKEVRTPLEDEPYDCRPWAGHGFVDGVVAHVDLPRCWDGRGLTPEHVVYEVEGACPPGFPHVLPELSERVHFGVLDPVGPDGTVTLTLSSGPYYTMHADFWNAWHQPRLDELIQECLVARAHCGGLFEGAELEWVRQFGTGRPDAALGVAVDASGAYVAGGTQGALPGKRSAGRADAFVRGYDPAGDVRWTRQFGTPGTERVAGVVADGEGGVYVVGSTDRRFRGQRSAGGEDVFVRRYDAAGSLAWTVQFGTALDDLPAAAALGGGSLFVAGTTWGRFRGEIQQGSTDAFVARVDLSGRLRWARHVGTSGADRGLGLAVHEGRVFLAGSTDGAFAGEVAGGGSDAFVARLRPDGSLAWTDQFGTPGLDEARGVAAGKAVYVAGVTEGTLGGEAAGGMDAFLRRYRPTGGEGWTRQFGTPGDDEVRAIAVRAAAVHVAGTAEGELPGQTRAGEADPFLRRYDAKGGEVWTHQFGTVLHDDGFALALDGRGAWIAGATLGGMDGEVALGGGDAFLARLRFV